jgi:Family of unknown function (DUF5996)
MASPGLWPSVSYEDWSETCDTLHGHTQMLEKLAATRAPPEPQLQHAALRLTARGWETGPLPAPDDSGAFAVALDLHAHEAVVEHSDGRVAKVPLTPNRSVGSVARGLLEAVAGLVGAVEIDPTPQEVSWSVPLDEDDEHASYDSNRVAAYFAAATGAALVLAAFRAPFRGRSSPVNAWWGSFDLAVNLYSGLPANPPSDDFIMRNSMDSQEVAVGWWPGDPKLGKAAFYAGLRSNSPARRSSTPASSAVGTRGSRRALQGHRRRSRKDYASWMSPPATLLMWFQLRSPELAEDFEHLMAGDRDIVRGSLDTVSDWRLTRPADVPGQAIGQADYVLIAEIHGVERFEQQASEHVQRLTDDLEHLVSSRGMLVVRPVL